MEKEYTETLLKDIDHAKSNEEKIHLMSILLADLAKENQELKGVITQLTEGQSNSAKFATEANNFNSEALNKIDYLAATLTKVAGTLSKYVEETNALTESVTRITNDQFGYEERFLHLANLLSNAK